MRGVGARWLLAGAVWLAAVGGGFGVLFRYASARGADSRAPVEWPASTRLPRAADRATLVMFVHPRCACSRASLTELHKLVGRVRGQVTPEVVFIIPRGVEAGWDRTDLRSLAEHVPEVRIFDDPGGDE